MDAFSHQKVGGRTSPPKLVSCRDRVESPISHHWCSRSPACVCSSTTGTLLGLQRHKLERELFCLGWWMTDQAGLRGQDAQGIQATGSKGFWEAAQSWPVQDSLNHIPDLLEEMGHSELHGVNSQSLRGSNSEFSGSQGWRAGNGEAWLGSGGGEIGYRNGSQSTRKEDTWELGPRRMSGMDHSWAWDLLSHANRP